MKRIGAFVGKFYPPHIGHLWVVDTLVNEFDEIYIIISKNEKRNNQIKDTVNFKILNAELIKEWFEKHYENNSKIKVRVFDESNFKPYPEDRDKWAEKFKKEFPSINVKIADESYREYNREYFPEYEFYAIERDIVKVHSSMLREDLAKNFDYLIPEAKQYFRKFLESTNENI